MELNSGIYGSNDTQEAPEELELATCHRANGALPGASYDE